MSGFQSERRRSGVIAEKLGMTRVFAEDGRHIPVTVLKIDGCQVTAQRTEETNGYTAVQLGAGTTKVKNITGAMRGHFAKARIEPKRTVAEFRVSEDALIDVGQEISADHFAIGQYVDVVGTSIGKGYAGGMKRHNFGGLRASHGVSVSHRAIGSTGQCQDPGKVFKGKKMPGQMGAVRRTVQNLKVVSTDSERGLILVRGSVPGPESGIVFVSDSVKKLFPEDAPFPASLRSGKSEESETSAEKLSSEDTVAGKMPAGLATSEKAVSENTPTEEAPTEAVDDGSDVSDDREEKKD